MFPSFAEAAHTQGVNEILKEPYWMTFHGLMRPFKCTLNLKLKAKRIKIEEIMAKQSQRELKLSSPFNKCVPHLKQVFKPG